MARDSMDIRLIFAKIGSTVKFALAFTPRTVRCQVLVTCVFYSG